MNWDMCQQIKRNRILYKQRVEQGCSRLCVIPASICQCDIYDFEDLRLLFGNITFHMKSLQAFLNVCKALGDNSLVEWVRIHLFSEQFGIEFQNFEKVLVLQLQPSSVQLTKNTLIPLSIHASSCVCFAQNTGITFYCRKIDE